MLRLTAAVRRKGRRAWIFCDQNEVNTTWKGLVMPEHTIIPLSLFSVSSGCTDVWSAICDKLEQWNFPLTIFQIVGDQVIFPRISFEDIQEYTDQNGGDPEDILDLVTPTNYYGYSIL
jgi:hypothetical protein